VPDRDAASSAQELERLRAIAECSRDVVTEIDRDARLLFLSPSFTKVFGWQPGEVIGKDVIDLVHPDDRRDVESIRAEAMAEQRPARLRFRLRHRDGGWRWVELDGRPYRTPSGELRAVLVSRDVSERVEAEQAFEHHLRVERRIAELSRNFLALSRESFDAGMREALAQAVEIAGVGRAHFVAIAPGRRIVAAYDWGAGARPAHGEEGWAQALRASPWISAALLRGEEVQIHGAEELPPEAASERAAMRAQGVRSYLALPLQMGDGVVGFLGFCATAAERRWSEPETSRLRLLAEVFASALRRHRVDLARHASEQRLRTLSEQARSESGQRALELERQLEVEKGVARFSRELLAGGASDREVEIRHGLEAAAAIAGADRAYLLSNLGGQPVHFDWHAPDIPPRLHAFGPAEPRAKDWVLRTLQARSIVRVERLDDLSEEACVTRAMLEAEGVRSLLVIPAHDGDRLQGVLGFHCVRAQKRWPEHEISLLRLVAELFASVLRRAQAEAELARSQKQLLQAQKMEAVGTLAGGIAHDFNNQLTVMLGNARFVLRRVQDADLREALSDLQRAAEHCAQLTRSLLAFSRRSVASPQPVDVARAVADMRDLVRPLLPSSIAFETALDPDLDAVRADPVQLQQVLINLAVNARDAMPRGGSLCVSARSVPLSESAARSLGLAAGGRYVEISVADTGEGMDEAIQARIFEPFFTTKGTGAGTGLGLATAYGIVKECGGAIAVESRPGLGSTFRVLLPPASAPDAANGDRAATPRPEGLEG
jgi:PAS domain S-box-containing protein